MRNRAKKSAKEDYRFLLKYRKIPKISTGTYIFQRPFSSGLFLEGLIFGGAYVRREICVSKSIELACSGKEIYHFCFALLCIRGQIPSTSPPGGLYSEGRFNGGFFWVTILRGLYLEGLIHGGAYFRSFEMISSRNIHNCPLLIKLIVENSRNTCEGKTTTTNQ